MHDWNRDVTGKSRGSGVCFLICKNLCIDVPIISQEATFNLEFITIKCRPFYFPCDFLSLMLTAVYMHPHADTNTALNDLDNAISMCEYDDASTLSVAAGDFNQANLESTIPGYKLYVAYPFRNNGIIDHCYCKVKMLINQNHVHVTVMLIMRPSC